MEQRLFVMDRVQHLLQMGLLELVQFINGVQDRQLEQTQSQVQLHPLQFLQHQRQRIGFV